MVWQVNTPDSALKPGDAIEQMDGVPVKELFARWRPYYADSNDAARMRDFTSFMTRGACGPVALDLVRDGKAVHMDAARVPPAKGGALWHDRPGDPFQMLSSDVAYLKLTDVKAEDVPGIFEKAKATKGMVIDLRDYPEYLPWVLAPFLATKPTPFVSFTAVDLANPGAFAFRSPDTLPAGEHHYGGKIVVLVDEVTQSRAEYTAMALRAIPGTVVVGSTTAGADGDASQFSLPGQQTTMVTGLGVFYPDHRPTQRLGIVPDVVVTPTPAGIAAGRDEVLERAVAEIMQN